ncbi:NAD(P)H-hydrate dehydratase [Oxalobacteraceae bacterium]|nr:NAD(P)H-hydrate dehydratase [Oxalobacteraceae bacterium]
MHPPLLPHINNQLLRTWLLPELGEQDDRDEHGHVLVIAGSREMPGAAVLAATAALRAGAGKLTVATAASVATLVAQSVPEARVLGWNETVSGGLRAPAPQVLATLLSKVRAVLIGPGMLSDAATVRLVHAVLAQLHGHGTSVILDACAMGAVLPLKVSGAAQGRAFSVPVTLTPHYGQMAQLCHTGKDAVTARPERLSIDAAARWNATVVLKGARSLIAAPDGHAWVHEGGNVGLAISGSGDTLAGIIAGLAARGANPVQAAAWGVALHARAGDRLAARIGPHGFLAREIPAEIPGLLREMGSY